MLRFLSKIYGFIVKKRRRYYKLHPEKQVHVDVPVISVGNISVGGSGKTPFCYYLATKLISLGLRPAIVGRGYKRKTKGLVIVSDGNKVMASVEEVGDEMYLLASLVKAPVIVNEKKYIAVKKANELFDIDCVIIDDGFQHLKIYRDVDIVLIDKETIISPYLLPKGRLREPLESVAETDFVCYYDDDSKDILLNFNKNLLKLNVSFFEPYEIFTKEQSLIANFIENKERVLLLSGIAQPLRFYQMIKDKNICIDYHLIFPDHHYYDQKDINRIIAIAERYHLKCVFTTEKDGVKLIGYGEIFAKNKIKVFTMPLCLSISDIDFEKIKNKIKYNIVTKD